MKRVSSVLALLIIAALAVGCGTPKANQGSASPTEGASEVKGDSPLTPSGQIGIAVTSEDGTEQIGAALPEGYPSDLFPIMAGAKIVGAAKMEDNYDVTYETKSKQEEAATYYEKILKDAPSYQLIDDRSGTGKMILQAVKGGLQLTAEISVQGDSGLTLVELDISPAD